MTARISELEAHIRELEGKLDICKRYAEGEGRDPVYLAIDYGGTGWETDPACVAVGALASTNILYFGPGPVAFRTFDGEGGYDYRSYDDNEDYLAEWEKLNPRHKGWVEPLYVTRPRVPIAWVARDRLVEDSLIWNEPYCKLMDISIPDYHSIWLEKAENVPASWVPLYE